MNAESSLHLSERHTNREEAVLVLVVYDSICFHLNYFVCVCVCVFFRISVAYRFVLCISVSDADKDTRVNGASSDLGRNANNDTNQSK